VKKELLGKGIGDASIKKLMSYLSITGNNLQKISKLRKIIGKDVEEIEEVIKLVKGNNVQLDVSLARGLAYYTGTVFEVYLKKLDITSSVAGGGRYDKMIGDFVDNNREYPAVGISFGIDVISDALKIEKVSKERSVAKAYIISIDQDRAAATVVNNLRNLGINVDVDLSGKVGKAVEYANYYGIPYVIFVGKKEASQKKVKIRDMRSGKEKLVSMNNIRKSLNF